MDSVKIHDQKFSLKSANLCEKAIHYIEGHLEKLNTQKNEIETSLNNSMLDFEDSEEQRNALEQTEKELSHFKTLLAKLQKRHENLSSKEFKTFAKQEIARVKKQSADLAALCLKEIPAASRKLALIAALLQKNEDEVYAAANIALEAGFEEEKLDIPFAMFDILQTKLSNRSWFSKLNIPLLNDCVEHADYKTYWPLPVSHDPYADNADIFKQAEDILKAGNLEKAAQDTFQELSKKGVLLNHPDENALYHKAA